MATTLIALGANLGDRRGNLQRAIALLDRPPAQRVVAHSRWFSTAPIGGPAGQTEFVNAAARVETSLSPLELLAVLRDIEAELGRQRRERWAARCVDLDLLLFDDLILKTPELELPHPRMAFRRFVLEPAADVAADLLHPVIGWTMGQLLSHLNAAPNYLAITGLPGVGKTELARAVAAATPSLLVTDPATEWSPSENAAAHTLADELSRWRQRSQLLARQRWTTESPVVISDFWLGQSLAYSRRWQDAQQRVALAAECRMAEAEVAQPKLLVFLDKPTVPEPWKTVREALRNLVYQRGRGPMLELDASRPEWALVELRAAVEAMR
ncbi:MAG: 2-amino-4-hydroxy-6-hydroxymethyldihydropteridine diphosphokinase [Pirellulaceae bacterium]|jgi:2-amino-4-hydroxy-6-hydroxymethyldihydropteridine diphosphokinase|nr:2-amino-4-hydroxy-6-hydroxymethyldihydropteridine diphosphokinase [Pirellulaceae bacterium]